MISLQNNLMCDSSGVEDSLVKDSVLHLPDVLVKCLGLRNFKL